MSFNALEQWFPNCERTWPLRHY